MDRERATEDETDEEGDSRWPLWQVGDTDGLVRYIAPDDVLSDDELRVDDEDFDLKVVALYETLGRRMVDFRDEPLESGDGLQFIRPPRSVLGHRAGNCLDLSVLLASAGYAQNLRPHLVLLAPSVRVRRRGGWDGRADVGHAMVAFTRHDDVTPAGRGGFFPEDAPVIDIERITAGASFEEACASGARHLKETARENVRLVDVTAGIRRLGRERLHRPPEATLTIGTYVPPPPLGYVEMPERMARLRKAFDRASDESMVIHGEAGSGKSVLARSLLMQQHLGDRLFLAASDLATLKRSMAVVQRRRLHLPPSLEGLAIPEIDAFAVGLRTALDDSPLPWTVVLDNLDQPRDTDVLSWFLPSGARRRVIITTNHPEWAKVPGIVSLGPLGAEEAVDFLQAASPETPPETLAQLAAAAGHLPVALHHVAGALASGLAADEALRIDRTPGDDPRTRWTAWSTRVAARTLAEDAWRFVSQLAYLAPEGIRPEDLPPAATDDEIIDTLDASRLVRHDRSTGFWLHRNTAAGIRLHAHPDVPRLLAELLDHEPLLDRLRLVGEPGEEGVVKILSAAVLDSGDQAQRATLLVRIASIEEILGGFNTSGKLHREALELWDGDVPAGRELLVADALHGEARSLNRDRQKFAEYGLDSAVAMLEQAKACILRARQLREDHGGEDAAALLARSDAMLGLIYLSWANVDRDDPEQRQRDLELANETLERSLDLRRELGPRIAPLELARGIYNIGALYLDLFRASTSDEERRAHLDHARDYYAEALVVRRAAYGANATNGQIAASLRGLGEVALLLSRLSETRREVLLASGMQDAASALRMRLELGGDPAGLDKARDTVADIAREAIEVINPAPEAKSA